LTRSPDMFGAMPKAPGRSDQLVKAATLASSSHFSKRQPQKLLLFSSTLPPKYNSFGSLMFVSYLTFA
jgi:hypothetical protein